MPASTASAIDTPNTTIRPWWNGPEIRCGKNSRPVMVCRFVGRQVRQHAGRREQVLERVDAEHRGEQRRHRRQRRRPAARRRAARPAPAGPLVSACGRLCASPAIISEKNTPIDSAVPEFWNVARMPDATPRSPGRHAAHDRGGVRRGEHAAADAVERDQQRERPVREVDRQQQQADEAQPEQQHADRSRCRARRTGPTARPQPGPRRGSPPSAAAGRCPPTAGCRRSRSRAAAARCPAAR